LTPEYDDSAALNSADLLLAPDKPLKRFFDSQSP
jgi:hypothetical protein